MNVKELDREIGNYLLFFMTVLLTIFIIISSADKNWFDTSIKLLGVFYLSVIAYKLSQIEDNQRKK